MFGYVYDAGGQRVAKGPITTFSCDVTTNGFGAQSQSDDTDLRARPGGEPVERIRDERRDSVAGAHQRVGQRSADRHRRRDQNPLLPERLQQNQSRCVSKRCPVPLSSPLTRKFLATRSFYEPKICSRNAFESLRFATMDVGRKIRGAALRSPSSCLLEQQHTRNRPGSKPRLMTPRSLGNLLPNFKMGDHATRFRRNCQIPARAKSRMTWSAGSARILGNFAVTLYARRS